MPSSCFLRRALAACACLLASLPADAQLIQLRYTGTVRYTDPGEGWFSPGQLVIDAGSTGRPLTPAQIDVVFNPQLAPHAESNPDDSVFFPASDPTGAAHTLRMRFGHVDLTLPLDRIEFDAPHGLLRFHSDRFGADVTLAQDNLPAAPRGSGLPTDFTFAGRVGFFSATIPGGLGVAPGFFEADLRRVSPVPEPAAYSAAALLLMSGLIARHFRRRGKTTAHGGAVPSPRNANAPRC
jgi:hypothetical protein